MKYQSKTTYSSSCFSESNTERQLSNNTSNRLINLNNGVEIVYYIYLFYSIFCIHLNIDIHLLTPCLLGIIAIMSIIVILIRFDVNIYCRYCLLLILTISLLYLIIQIMIYNIMPNNLYVKSIILWPLTAIIIYVQIDKPIFLIRLSIVMFIITLLIWPTIKWMEVGEGVYRAVGEGSAIVNPNDLAAWIGFCVLVFALWGLTQIFLYKRLLIWVCSLISCLMMLKTVSRASLAAVTIAIVIGLRKISFMHRLAIVFFLVLSYIILIKFIPGFHESVSSYQSRGLEETGRFAVWPACLEAIIHSPFMGYSADFTGLPLGSIVKKISPHNAFLFFGVTSGIIPMFIFIILWITAFRYAFIWDRVKSNYIVDPLPLVTYAFLMICTSNIFFVYVWAVVPIFYSAVTVQQSKFMQKVIVDQ